MAQIAESIADLLWRLRSVSGGQWSLRILATLAALVAARVAIGWPPFGSLPAGIASLTVLAMVLWQCARPGDDAGTVAIVMITLAFLARGLEWPSALLIGVLLLLAHSCWALAALAPAHAQIERSTWRRTAGPVALALLIAVAATAMVLALVRVHLGAPMLLLGALALCAIVVALTVPGARRRGNRTGHEAS